MASTELNNTAMSDRTWIPARRRASGVPWKSGIQALTRCLVNVWQSRSDWVRGLETRSGSAQGCCFTPLNRPLAIRSAGGKRGQPFHRWQSFLRPKVYPRRESRLLGCVRCQVMEGKRDALVLAHGAKASLIPLPQSLLHYT